MVRAWAAVVRHAIAAALAYEAVGSVVWMGRILTFAAVYDAPVFVMVGARAIVTAAELVATAALWRGRPAGVPLAQASLALSAVLVALEVGAGLAPSSTPPGQRGLTVVAYAVYAAAAIWLLRRGRSDR